MPQSASVALQGQGKNQKLQPRVRAVSLQLLADLPEYQYATALPPMNREDGGRKVREEAVTRAIPLAVARACVRAGVCVPARPAPRTSP